MRYRDSDTPMWVNIRGRRVKSGRYTEVGYAINADGVVEPHYRNGPAPQWIVELVERASEES